MRERLSADYTATCAQVPEVHPLRNLVASVGVCNQIFTSDNGVVAAAVKKYASRRQGTAKDLVSLDVGKGEKRW